MLHSPKTLRSYAMIHAATPMTNKHRRIIADIEADPFGEQSAAFERRVLQIMGGRFEFESNSEELLRLVDEAYNGLPPHRFVAQPPRFRIRLILAQAGSRTAKTAPYLRAPSIPMLHGAGFLGSATDSSTFVVLSPAERSALIFVSREMLKFPYHVRYELIEFAIFTLASRVQRLVPLHAACVGLGGRGILLMGPSGAGKTTVALQSLLAGFDFLAEDSVFVAPRSMRATGVANFLHVRADSLNALEPRVRTLIRSSPTIRRRSGVKKFEVDLRRKPFLLSRAPLTIVGVAFLSASTAGKGPLLRRLPRSETLAKLKNEQGYAAGLAEWREFSRSLATLGVEICRGVHPRTTVETLRLLLTKRSTKPRR
jgi:hypothetical protein